MRLHSQSFDHQAPIPERYAFCRRDPAQHATLSDNRCPAFEWSDAPDGTQIGRAHV